LYKNGNEYIGAFKDGIMSGSGEFIWSKGGIFKGLWKNGKPNGKGEFTDVIGKKTNGEFDNGTIIISEGEKGLDL